MGPLAQPQLVVQLEVPVLLVLVLVLVLVPGGVSAKDRLSRTMECVPLSADKGGFVFYNRIPKCASTTTALLFRDLTASKRADELEEPFYLFRAHQRHFKPLRPWERNTEYTEQWAQLRDLISASRHRRTVYVNHVLWPNFTAFVRPTDAFASVNVMRDPLSRYISAYYYLMYGPRAEESIQEHQRYMMELLNVSTPPDINQYILGAQNFSGCSPHRLANIQLTYFCGFDPVCRDPCSREALHRAKYVMATEYDAVGLLERYEETLELFEALLPSFFRGLPSLYRGKKQKHARVTNSERHVPPTPEVELMIRAQNQPDFALYEFAEQLFKEKLAACGIQSLGANRGRAIPGS